MNSAKDRQLNVGLGLRYLPKPKQLYPLKSSKLTPSMVLELHVWGPAFTLPSIDPQCLAVIFYISYALPQDHWVLVANSDAGWSPTSS